MMRTENAVGVVLSRNEIWLLLHALSSSAPPPLSWDGDPLEPWELGELQAKLREALHPDSVKGVDERPVITMDSDMGKHLAMAGVKPLVVPDGYDIGSLLAACAARGWGAELSLPRGAVPETPASATVHTRRDRAGELPDERTYVGLERPVVALARAVIGALVEARAVEELAGESPSPVASPPDATLDVALPENRFEEHVIYGNAIGRGMKQRVITGMARQGWELVTDEGHGPNDRIVFRRPKQPPELPAG